MIPTFPDRRATRAQKSARRSGGRRGGVIGAW